MAKVTEQTAVIDWLMQGDPAVRWQTMRDVLGKPAGQWKSERLRVATEGWGGQLLSLRDPAGTWGGGIYTPKWTSANYTLLLLRDMGTPRGNSACHDSAGIILDREMSISRSKTFAHLLAKLDLCLPGMYLALLVYFDAKDERIRDVVEHLLRQQMDDGGWNCKRRQHQAHHSSLHTTINVLDGLGDYARYHGAKAEARVGPAIARAHEFMLQHRLFRSDKTGKVINDHFTQFSFPPRWHYDALRALDYFRRVNAPRDPRLADAMDLLLSKRRPDGRWKLENHHRGKEFFHLEKQGQPSRWNTLRALRVLRWWNGE